MRVEKIAYEVVIFTESYKIEGEIHLIEGERITDFVRTVDSTFLPITNVTLSTVKNGQFLYKTEFLSLNRDKISIIMPRHNIIE